MPDAYGGIDVNKTQLAQIILVLNAIRQETAAGGRVNPALLLKNREVVAMQDEFFVDLRVAGRIAANAFDLEARAILRGRQVRPPTGNAPGLADVIVSAPNVAAPIQYGVDFALLATLNLAVNRAAGSSFPYWWAQEFGSTGNLGRQIQGTFYNRGGATQMPSPLQFRMHALFRPGLAGRGTITHAIEPKWFLRDAKRLAETMYRAEVGRAWNALAAKLKAL